MELIDNVERIQALIRAACHKSDREVTEVKIVAISKGFDIEKIRTAFEAGLDTFGENYLNESLQKKASLQGLPIHWHFTGHLQRNKAETVANNFELIHSIDSVRLAETLQKTGEQLNKKIPALIQFKCDALVAHGFSEEEIWSASKQIQKLDNLSIQGIMTMAPYHPDCENVRPLFRKTKQVFIRLQEIFLKNFSEISMGMSGDFQVAVEEGATLIRIGTAIFGKR